ncbi:CaiB/BaiF CoA transferase family protein [Novosphingobium bradum]|uniref:CaiB/BaiF CoA transferase family protein n=1 Tax=Novosphingobium bradum TaxID=1737444 RepID=A0ABV7IS66_9SPHN
MTRPLEGVTIVEVAMWAFVPAAGGILADMGASVIKIEPPTGDPLRGLSIAGSGGQGRINVSWENYNRGKRSVTLDLRQQAGVEVLYKLIEDADVFMTNLLPPARRRMKIDIADLQSRNPKLIYAVGSGIGRQGPDGDKGGYDSISFWARGGIASSVSPAPGGYPAGMPSGAFGDSLSAAVLAGGVAAAIAQRALTGHAAVVDASLLNTGMWAMQRAITQATLDGVKSLPGGSRETTFNPLTNIYRTADDRYLSLCMLQGQRYWPEFCKVAGRPDLVDDPRFATDADRVRNAGECVRALDDLFASKSLAEWREILARQDGQWDVVQEVGELHEDPQVVANGYMQEVALRDGRKLKVISAPLQFDGAPLPASGAPEVGEHSDEVLAALGFDEEAILNLKIAGVVF